MPGTKLDEASSVCFTCVIPMNKFPRSTDPTTPGSFCEGEYPKMSLNEWLCAMLETTLGKVGQSRLRQREDV